MIYPYIKPRPNEVGYSQWYIRELREKEVENYRKEHPVPPIPEIPGVQWPFPGGYKKEI
jgi:hypothetical protein